MRILRTLLFVTLVALIATNVSAQKKDKQFKGIIVYEITYPKEDVGEEMKDMLPSKMTTYILGTKKKNELFSLMANQSEIVDAEAMTRTSLIDVMGQKFAILTTKEEIEKELAEAGEQTINYFDELKEIAGYMCTKAEIVTKDENEKETTVEIFFTNEIKNQKVLFEGEFRDIEGIPLEFVVHEERITMMFTAIEVTHGKVKDKDFDIPEGYKFVTEKELKEMFGG